MRRWRHLSENKHLALFWLIVFERDLKIPRCTRELVRDIEITERYKVLICVLISYLELTIKRRHTDLNETRVLINCIKKTLPRLNRRHRLNDYLDKAYNMLAEDEHQNNQAVNERQQNG
ncbi:MAG: hypothetical protein DRP56_08210 [Planctomycetota bacterium]|nr:MAG: hypothetical protein DRP56_08210 [Planctomycetota bacterium]